jgi:endonuclease/exonuclease/phosphatase family metal-dependent hydrolase
VTATLASVIADTPYLSTAGLRASWTRHETDPAQPMSLRELLRRHDTADAGLDLVFANTYLMGPVRVNVEPLVKHFQPGLWNDYKTAQDYSFGLADPALKLFKKDTPTGSVDISQTDVGQVPERARELGAALRSMQAERGRPLVAALCECWDGIENTVLTAAGPGGAPPNILHGPGPDEDWRGAAGLFGSGLAAVAFDAWISKDGEHTYQSRGTPNSDIDFYAAKGAMLIRVTLPLGHLQVYLTHLHSGGDIPADAGAQFAKLVGAVRTPSVAEMENVRREQIGELAEFVRTTSQPGCPTLIVGDFNTDPRPYLAGTWLEPWRDAWFQARQAETVTIADTHQKLSTIAHCAAVDGSFSADACGPLSAAVEPPPPAPGSRHIDFVLLSRTSPSDAFIVDVVTVERLPWRRAPSTGSSAMPYLSDHVGLRLRLRISPPSPDVVHHPPLELGPAVG